MAYDKYTRSSEKGYTKRLEYKKYRVKSPVKTFRDLEVYKNTTQLAVEIFQIKVPKQAKNIEKEFDILKDLTKPIPKLIAESNGDEFSNLNCGVSNNLTVSGIKRDKAGISEILKT